MSKLKTFGFSLWIVLVSIVGSAQEPPTLLVLGDSLSAGYGIATEKGWVALLETRLKAKKYPYRVINESISGDTTTNGLIRLRSIIARQSISILVVELGANDGLRGHSVNQIERNLRAIIRLGKEAGARVVLLGISLPNNYGKRYNQSFEAVYRSLSASEGVPLAPSLVEGVPLEEDYFQDDYLHPNALAQPIMLENVWRVLEGLL